MRNNEHYKSALLLCKRWLYLFFALFVGIDLCAQNINVKGKVVDENSLAIIGANKKPRKERYPILMVILSCLFL